jgi:hypothetical protein
VLGSTWFLGAAVALASWPLRSVAPGAGADPSWQTALHYAAEHRLDFGTQVIFNYGPLGFLKVPLVPYDVTAALSGIYALLVQLALGLTLVWAARRSFPLPGAVLIAFVAASLMAQQFIPTEVIIPVVFIWCVVALGEDPPPFSWSLVVFGGGIVSAIEILGKLNTGPLLLAMCAVTVLVLQGQRRRSLPLFATTFLATLAILWFAAGQGAGNVDDYLSTGFEIISGYSGAIGIDAAAVGWDRAAALGLIVVALAGTYLGARDLPPPRRAVTALLVLLLSFALFKQAFVRHYYFFMPLFVSTMLAPWLAFCWRGTYRLVAAAAIAVISVLYFPLSQGSLTADSVTDTVRPIDRADAAADRLGDLILPGARRRAQASAKARLRSLYALDPPSLALLAGRSVAIQRSEFSLAWAYDLDWTPLPVLGAYTAFTPELDRRNAQFIASTSGPERMLRHRPGVERGPAAKLFPSQSSGGEDRFAPYEGPETTRATLCHFEALRTTERFQVLGRISDRCGQRTSLGSRVTEYGRPVKVPRAPRAKQAVFANVNGLAPTGVERIRTLLYRAGFRYVVFDGTSRYRIFPETQDDLIVSAPRRADFPAPFALAPNPRTIEFDRQSGLGVSGGKLTISFYALPIRTTAPRARGR